MESTIESASFAFVGLIRADSSIEHLERIQKRLGLGRKILEELTPEKWEAYPVPDVSVNQDLSHRPPPKKGD